MEWYVWVLLFLFLIAFGWANLQVFNAAHSGFLSFTGRGKKGTDEEKGSIAGSIFKTKFGIN